MEISVLAITKNGIRIGERLKKTFPEWQIFAPSKLADQGGPIVWYSEPTPEKIAELFKKGDAVICLFSLGAVIRLIAPHLRGKKTDPAVIVIDDGANFVISALSGHIGGANRLAEDIARKLDAQAVITTAADVNMTIAVDMVGRDLGWKIEDDSAVTRVSADMVNEEPIGVFQDAGSKRWYEQLPKNVTLYDTIEELEDSRSKSSLIISDKLIRKSMSSDSVIYRPASLVVGVGLHQDTSKETIINGIQDCLERFGLSLKSVARLASIKKPKDVQGLAEAGTEMGVPVEYVRREDLAEVTAPNPSEIVRVFEGTASVSEAAAILVSGGSLIVEKQKFPPDLTVAVARMKD